jgi:DUF4097 and DUF4098 domain-containing protein YvlB
MKRIPALLLLILVGAAPLQAQTADAPFLTKSLSKESIHDIYARTSGGEIEVSGVSAGDARIEVYVHTSNNRSSLTKEEIQRRLDKDYDLTISVEDDKLTAIAKPKDSNMNWKNALTVSFKMFVPEKVSTDLSTSGGGIKLTNLSGTLDFATSGGGLSLDQLSGKIHGRTSGGGITLTNSKDDIDLSTSGGGIKASNCSGTLRLSTSGGAIDLNDLKGSIDANTSGGPVRASGIGGELIARTSGGSVNLSHLACSVEAHTSGGNMDVAITELGKYVTVSNSGGNIHLEVPGDKGIDLKLRAERIKMNNLNNFSGEQDEHKVTGKINGGGVPVDVRTSGSITLAVR